MATTDHPAKPRQRAGIHTAIRAGAFTRAFAPAVSAVLICLCVAGCASPSAGSNTQAAVPAFRDPAMSMQSANEAITIGTSTRAEVLAALGPAIVVKFDSGYEVWAYRKKSPERSPEKAATPAELVILFAPSGVVKKTRIKPQY